MLPEAFASASDRLVRFERMANLLASLNHPNIGHITGNPCLEFLCRWALMASYVGETTRALDTLERVVDRGWCCAAILAREPWLDHMCDEPRFVALLARGEERHRGRLPRRFERPVVTACSKSPPTPSPYWMFSSSMSKTSNAPPGIRSRKPRSP